MFNTDKGNLGPDSTEEPNKDKDGDRDRDRDWVVNTPTKLTRHEIIGMLNAIIDLYIDVPPKVVSGPRILPPKVPPLIIRVPRVPDKLVLPENKQRGDAILDTIDTLRTYVKYGLFERDALRREVSYLKRLVEDLDGDV